MRARMRTMLQAFDPISSAASTATPSVPAPPSSAATGSNNSDASNGVGGCARTSRGHSPPPAQRQALRSARLGTSLGERAISMSALALYLGYFSFSRFFQGSPDATAEAEAASALPTTTLPPRPLSSTASLSPEPPSQPPTLPSSAAPPYATCPALDLLLLVTAAEQHQLALLPPLLPAITAFLWMLPHSSKAATKSPAFMEGLRKLMAIRARLLWDRPSSLGLPAVCCR